MSHLRRSSLWCRVVCEALTARGFYPWTATPRLMESFIHASGIICEIYGGSRIRFVWKGGGEREYTLRMPTDIDLILDEILETKS